MTAIKESETAAASALRRLALNEQAKAYVLARPELYGPLLRAAARYIGGETLDACLDAVRTTNKAGHAATIDFMGESTRDPNDASEATDEFVRVCQAIAEHDLDASVSLDLSHIGLLVGEAFCMDNASVIAAAAQAAGTELMISAEGTERTDTILRVHGNLCEQYDNVGMTIQTFLYRSPNDLDVLLERPGKIRIVKGAFDAPAELAMQRGPELDAAYIEFVQTLVEANHPCSIATHDPDILSVVEPKVGGSDDAEFEMLRGVTPERLDKLNGRGYPTRAYIPYGREWFLYLLNRLAENPPSIFEAIAAVAQFGQGSSDNQLP